MTSSEQMDPNQAAGAQLPLPSFNLPDFPVEARYLKALTLTSDIKLDEYSELLKGGYSIPEQLPEGIESLTLELFSLGYPPGMLTDLSKKLSNIKTLVVYSQLFAGTTAESEQDAGRFFENCEHLRALHLLDVFVRPDFFSKIGKTLSQRERGLMFLEVNYTMRHDDKDFLGRIQSKDLASLIMPGLITCTLQISPPDETNDPQDPTNLDEEGKELKKKPQGVMPLSNQLSKAVVKALTDDATAPRSMRLLNITLFTITVDELKTICQTHRGMMVLSVSLYLEPSEDFKKKLMRCFIHCPDLEQIEIIGNPSMQYYMAAAKDANGPNRNYLLDQDDIEHLSSRCAKLASFEATIMVVKTLGYVSWKKQGDSWTGGIVEPTE